MTVRFFVLKTFMSAISLLYKGRGCYVVEMIKVIDRGRNVLGVKSREAVHLDGDWHETFQCWFIELVEDCYYIYLQLRSASKKDFPSMYDITAAGHLLASETVADGVREIKEELGIELNLQQLVFLDAIPNSIVLDSFIDNEVSLVYLYEVKESLTFRFEDEEVEAVVRVKLQDFKSLYYSQVDAASYELYERGQFIASAACLTLEQIVPHEWSYIKKVISKIEAHIKGK